MPQRKEVAGRLPRAVTVFRSHRFDIRDVDIHNHEGQATGAANAQQTNLLNTRENEAIDKRVLDAQGFLIGPTGHKRKSNPLIFTGLSHPGKEVVLEGIFKKLRDSRAPERQDADGVDLTQAQHSPSRVRSVVAQFMGGGFDAREQLGSNKVGPAESVGDSRLRHLGGSRDVEKC